MVDDITAEVTRLRAAGVMKPTPTLVDPPGRPGVAPRVVSALAATRLARFVSRHVSWKLDPLLLGLTGGRVASTLVFPTAVLETRGAHSGASRRNAVIYFHDGDRLIIAASNAGSPRHPAWYHNLRAHRDVVFGGAPMRATVIKDEDEQERLWSLADYVFPAFATYRRDAAKHHRTIPLIQLVALKPPGAS
jgi:deazaflavin-dependent oxidoreductase (nitroreductase family)